MVEPLKSLKLNGNDEPLRRYHAAVALMRRAADAWYRDAHADGECIQDVMSDVQDFVNFEDLETLIFEQQVVPVSKRATGRAIADLTGIEHVCEFQQAVKSH